MNGRTFAVLIAALVFGLIGCGGGGGGGGSVNMIKRSVNLITSNPDPIDAGSHGPYIYTGKWVSIPPAGQKPQVLGDAKFISPFEKVAGTGTATLNSNGTFTIVNDLAQDLFTVKLTAQHDPNDPTDPDRGTIESGVQPIAIKPQDIRVVGANPFEIAQDGSVDFVVQAQNARGLKKYEIKRVPRDYSPTRLFVNINASFAVQPANAGVVTKSTNGSYRFTAASGFTGNVQITISVPDAFGNPYSQVENGVILPHPLIAISSPTENQSVTGTIAVTYSAANAARVTYAIDNGTETDATGGVFSLNTTTLANGNHTIVMKAYGKKETASTLRNVTVNNTTGGGGDKKGDVTIDATPISTDQDGKGLINASRYVFKDGGAVTVSDAGIVRFWNPDGSLSATRVDLKSITYTFTVDNLERIWVPSDNDQITRVLTRSGVVIKTLATGHMTKARYCSQMDKVLVCGPAGLVSFDATYNKNTILSSYVVSACANDKYYFYQDGSLKLYRRLLTATPGQASEQIGSTNLLFDMYAAPAFDLVMGTDGTTKTIFRMKVNGDTTGFNTLALPGNRQVQGIGVDLRDSTGQTISVSPNPDPSAYNGHVVEKP